MIEDKAEEERGIYNHLIAGYNEGIESTKKNKLPRLDRKEGSFLERQAYDMGEITAFYFFPYTHPRIELRKMSERVRKIRRYFRREK